MFVNFILGSIQNCCLELPSNQSSSQSFKSNSKHTAVSVDLEGTFERHCRGRLQCIIINMFKTAAFLDLRDNDAHDRRRLLNVGDKSAMCEIDFLCHLKVNQFLCISERPSEDFETIDGDLSTSVRNIIASIPKNAQHKQQISPNSTVLGGTHYIGAEMKVSGRGSVPSRLERLQKKIECLKECANNSNALEVVALAGICCPQGITQRMTNDICNLVCNERYAEKYADLHVLYKKKRLFLFKLEQAAEHIEVLEQKVNTHHQAAERIERLEQKVNHEMVEMREIRKTLHTILGRLPPAGLYADQMTGRHGDKNQKWLCGPHVEKMATSPRPSWESRIISAGTKIRNEFVPHMWAKWLHHPYRLGGPQR